MRPQKLGDLELRAKRIDHLRSELFYLYERNATFKADLVTFWLRYRRLLDALIRCKRGQDWGVDRTSQPDFAWRAALKLARGLAAPKRNAGLSPRIPLRHLGYYTDELQRFAHRWGLRATWAVEWLHVGLIDPFVLARFGAVSLLPEVGPKTHSYNWEGRDEVVRIALEVGRRDKWSDVQDRVLESARSQWDAYQSEWVRADDWSRQDTKPELGNHVKWLYLRICPQVPEGPPKTWASIAGQNNRGVTTVTRVVKEMAGEMGVQLPQTRPGRRPKHSASGALGARTREIRARREWGPA